MVRQINSDKRDAEYAIDLYYSVKNENDAVFSQEFMETSKRNAKFRFFPYFSEKSGRISADFIFKNSKDIRGAEIFLCGPPVFMQSLKKQFIKMGFKKNEVHSEEFSL